MSDKREQLQAWLESHDMTVLLADGFDDAFIGVGERFHELSTGGAEKVQVAVYDIDRCLDILMADGMSFEEADEYFTFNTLGAYVGPQTPIFVKSLSHDWPAVDFVSQADA